MNNLLEALGTLPARPSVIPNDLWYGTSGPRNARIAIVGEAWGEMEEIKKQPFVGQSGEELTRMLAEAGINRAECFITNCVPARPKDNDISEFFYGKPTRKNSHNYSTYRRLYPNDLLRTGLERLYTQLDSVRPDLIIACGNTALWALSSDARISQGVPSGISDFRGSMLFTDDSLPFPKTKLLPILHPAAILRAWYNRQITVHDLKVRTKLALANDYQPRTVPLIEWNPSFERVIGFLESQLHRCESGRETWLSCDIETRRQIITCLGLGDSSRSAMVIPFVRMEKEGFLSHWTQRQEMDITVLLTKLLSHKNARLIGQNFMYDMTYLHRFYSITPNLAWDTMGFQHLLLPGTPKDLGYLSSMYCHYHRYWKDDNKEWDGKESMETHLRYNGEDCVRTFEIFEQQRTLLDDRLSGLWSIELEKHQMAFEMAAFGVRIDTKRKAQLSMDLYQASQERIAWLLKIVPQAYVEALLGTKQKTTWPTSAAQQKVVFYDIMQLTPQRHRKTGAITLDKEALPKLKKQAPWASRIIDTLLELRSINVFASTFVNASLSPDGRMRTSFNPFGTETFRWSSSTNPFGEGCNFQNLPTGNED